jgi:hypothetical protein
MKSLTLALLYLFALGIHGAPLAQTCYESTVQSPSPFLGNDGEIVKLADGSLWEVKNSYNYMYKYYPAIIICPDKGKLLVGDKSINVQLVSSPSPAPKGGGNLVESIIVSKFEGLNAGNFYKLANGQIWEQVEAWVWVWIWVNPNVTIYPSSGGYKMKVENIDHSVLVRRVR